MKKEFSKSEAKKIIDHYFSNELNKEKTLKIKKLAMKHRIRLGKYRKKFCKKCYEDLADGKIRTTKYYRTVECKCGYKNKSKIRINY